MSLKHTIVAVAAAMTITLSGTLGAQSAADEAAAAQAYSRMKVDEATAADDKFHANRTQANMLARDKAEAEAAAAVEKAHAAADRAAGAAGGSGSQAGRPPR
jgi:hypothetical protein